MIVDLLYGKTRMAVRLDDALDVTVVTKPALPIIDDAPGAVVRALREPVDCAPLETLAKGCATACILVCDVTRPVPNALFLRPLIETLLGAGVPQEGITVLIATGLHRPNEGEELRGVIGDPWVFEHANVVNHFARDDEAHVDLGHTAKRGTPVKIDKRFVQADLRIATGLVEPHFMAGYSGGRKVVAPGVAHADTIRTFHSARFMEDPLAASCNLEGNPLHEEQLEIIRMIGDVVALNTVIDDERRLSLVNFGEVVASHAEAVAYVHDACTVELPRRFHTVVTSSAGYPLDQTYYQTVKGMVTPLDILEHDATLIIASECGEGLGSEAFRASQKRLMDEGSERFMERILAKRFADIDEWQSEMLLKSQRRAHIQMLSSLKAQDHELTGVTIIDDIERAVAESVRLHGDPAVAVIPEGPYVVPRSVA